MSGSGPGSTPARSRCTRIASPASRVHIAARVMAQAGPGEILVSRTVRDLVAGSDLAMEDRGAHALKGVDGEWQLFAVDATARATSAGPG
jgi:class 3 adenylate cyclase